MAEIFGFLMVVFFLLYMDKKDEAKKLKERNIELTKEVKDFKWETWRGE